MSGGRVTGAKEIADLVVAVERAAQLDHSDWLIDDVHLWPLYRMEIYFLLFLELAGSRASSAQRALGTVLRSARASTAMPDGPCVWLVSDGISYARIGRQETERFCGPLWNACQALGLAATVIDRGSPAPRRYQEPTRWWAPWTQRAKVLATVAARVAPDRRHERLVARVRAAAGSLAPALRRLDPRRLDAKARAVVRLARVIGRRLRREQVRCVFVVGYYDVAGYAYLLASARLGIPSVDIQHGVIGPLHMGYAQWNVHPPRGFRLLPSWFWTWTPADAAVIDAWARHTGAAHRALCGGNPFLEAWRSGEIAIDDSLRADADRLVQAATGRTRVLVTLQINLGSAQALSPLLAAMAAMPEVAWWLRLHPMALADQPRIEELLRNCRARHWNIAQATALPLPVLLRHADLHATHSSSTVVEAAAMGVRSIVWSEYGAELFADQITSGIAEFAGDAAQFERALARPVPRGGPGEAPAPDRRIAALNQLLQSPA
jgi:hypothetical protein